MESKIPGRGCRWSVDQLFCYSFHQKFQEDSKRIIFIKACMTIQTMMDMTRKPAQQEWVVPLAFLLMGGRELLSIHEQRSGPNQRKGRVGAHK